MNHRRFVLFGAVGVVALVAVLVVTNLSSGLTYYLYPSEAVAQKADFPDGTRFRLAGNVVDGTVVADGTLTRFVVSDGEAEVPVDLEGRVPPLFDEGVPVLVEGSWEGGTFVAYEAVVRHDENYSTPETGGGYSS